VSRNQLEVADALIVATRNWQRHPREYPTVDATGKRLCDTMSSASLGAAFGLPSVSVAGRASSTEDLPGERLEWLENRIRGIMGEPESPACNQGRLNLFVPGRGCVPVGNLVRLSSEPRRGDG
jgi:hypothetical protein